MRCVVGTPCCGWHGHCACGSRSLRVRGNPFSAPPVAAHEVQQGGGIHRPVGDVVAYGVLPIPRGPPPTCRGRDRPARCRCAARGVRRCARRSRNSLPPLARRHPARHSSGKTAQNCPNHNLYNPTLKDKELEESANQPNTSPSPFDVATIKRQTFLDFLCIFLYAERYLSATVTGLLIYSNSLHKRFITTCLESQILKNISATLSMRHVNTGQSSRSLLFIT